MGALSASAGHDHVQVQRRPESATPIRRGEAAQRETGKALEGAPDLLGGCARRSPDLNRVDSASLRAAEATGTPPLLARRVRRLTSVSTFSRKPLSRSSPLVVGVPSKQARSKQHRVALDSYPFARVPAANACSCATSNATARLGSRLP